jgi:hypothetical protein
MEEGIPDHKMSRDFALADLQVLALACPYPRTPPEWLWDGLNDLVKALKN